MNSANAVFYLPGNHLYAPKHLKPHAGTPVIMVEDSNPNQVTGESERGMPSLDSYDDMPGDRAVDPGAIVVGAAVTATVEIHD